MRQSKVSRYEIIFKICRQSIPFQLWIYHASNKQEFTLIVEWSTSSLSIFAASTGSPYFNIYAHPTAPRIPSRRQISIPALTVADWKKFYWVKKENLQQLFFVWTSVLICGWCEMLLASLPIRVYFSFYFYTISFLTESWRRISLKYFLHHSWIEGKKFELGTHLIWICKHSVPRFQIPSLFFVSAHR